MRTKRMSGTERSTVADMPPAAQAARKAMPRDWLHLAGGACWALHGPRPGIVSPGWIAHGLGQTCRFNGHTTVFYSVAQHAVVLTGLLPAECQAHGLLHDAQVAVVGTLPAPVRAHMTNRCGADPMADLEARTRETIHRAFGLDWPPAPDILRTIAQAKRRVFATEIRDLMAVGPLHAHCRDEPLPRVLRSWPAPKATEKWLECLDTLSRLGRLRLPPS